MMAKQDNPITSPRDMGTWDSDDFHIVVDSATSKTITPLFSDLIDPQPCDANLVQKKLVIHFYNLHVKNRH